MYKTRWQYGLHGENTLVYYLYDSVYCIVNRDT